MEENGKSDDNRHSNKDADDKGKAFVILCFFVALYFSKLLFFFAHSCVNSLQGRQDGGITKIELGLNEDCKYRDSPHRSGAL